MPESKDKWNSEHYDQVIIRLPKGARDELKAIAGSKGMSVAGYLKHLVVADLDDQTEPIAEILRGGGLLQYWMSYPKSRKRGDRE